MSPARRLLTYLLRYRLEFAIGFVCVIGTAIIGLASPWVLKLAIDDLTQGVDAAKIRLYAGAVFGLAAAGGTLRFLMRRIIIGASRGIEYDLRNDFFAHLQRLDLGYFQHHRTGDLMSRATNDLSAVRMMFGPAIMYSATTVLTFIIGIALMFAIDTRLTLISLIPLPLISLSVWYFGTILHRRFERIQEQLSEISAIVQETLSGVRVVRAYGQEASETRRFRMANDEYVHRNMGLIHVQALFFPVMGLCMGIGALLVLWLGSRAVIEGRLTVGELVAFNSYLLMLAWPMIAFGWVTNLIQRGMASWKRILEILDTPPAILDAPHPGRLRAAGDIKGEIEFRHLTFAHGPHAVLHDITAVLPSGTTTAIVGTTGSGKSTLLNLLPRLYDPPPGTVFVDGVDVREIPLGVLRGAIGFVPQEPFLFGTSIEDNVAFGRPGGDADADGDDWRTLVEHAAGIARLDKDVEAFPRGYDTVVGERGITLSGGQKQRTAIARALVLDPKILILDDALSAVDTYTEEEILGRLRDVMRQRTTLIVSHRVSTVRHADLILVFSSGRIVERGTHDELVSAHGVYAAMHRKQLLEEELAAS